MKVRKYTARTSRDALRQVREDLGPDAVILANRMVRGGVELLAMPASEMLAHAPETRAAPTAPAAEALAPIEFSEDDVVDPGAALRPGERREPALEPQFDVRVPGRTPATAPARPAARAGRPSSADAIRPSEWALEPRFEAPPVARRALGAPAAEAEEPAIFRRRGETGERPAAPTPPAAQAQPAARPAALAELAAAQEPLIAALAGEVRALGSLASLGLRPVVPPPAARPTDSVPAPEPLQTLRAIERTALAASGEAWIQNMMGELRSMRLLIEDQIGALAAGGNERMAPGKLRTIQLLSAAGFSIPLIRKLTARLPDSISAEDAQVFVRNALARNLDVVPGEGELLDQGGVFALVGPTGAGKTTTAAKIAARFVVRHGAENLALLTTDGYRIGGQEQLRIYGKILGVAVYAVKDAEDLKRTLGELRNRKLVLIDTVGLSQRDRLVAEQLDLFAACGVAVKRLLLLNATCHNDTLEDVARAYRGLGLAGCILSKLDEAVASGAALDTAIRQRLRVWYTADGQRVPEDLRLPDAAALVENALRRPASLAGEAANEADFPIELPAMSSIGALRPGLGEGGAAHG